MTYLTYWSVVFKTVIRGRSTVAANGEAAPIVFSARMGVKIICLRFLILCALMKRGIANLIPSLTDQAAGLALD
jgi:hypothetical protein